MKTLIVIPARYHSTRLPGKPLAVIRGQTMLERVVRIAEAALQGVANASLVVATDDERIVRHCHEIGVTAVMTSQDSPSGTDRVSEVVSTFEEKPEFILNMQGDAPLTPPDFIRAMIDAFRASPSDVITPVTQLTWEELDKLRETKQSTPFSGTTVVFNEMNGHAFWFSKTIIPAIRQEAQLRMKNDKSPVYRHIGLYGYACHALEKYIHLPESMFEKLEGLEQLRMLENGYTIRCLPVDYHGRANMSGVDSEEDIKRAESLIMKHGELLSAPSHQEK